MRKKGHITEIILLLFACMAATAGCSKKIEERPLELPDNVKSVKDFSEYKETDLQRPTEAQTEPPTEPHTEPPTEPPTEKPTEPPTEPEVAHAEDYDFSEVTVVSAAAMGEGGSSAMAYTSTARQDYIQNIRTQKILFGGGTKEITLIADDTSGKTNKRIEFKYPAEERDKLIQALLWLNDGITQDNIEKFMSGYYNGEDGAPLIGLKNAAYANEGNSISVMLEKFPSAHGAVPGWSDAAIDFSVITGSKKLTGTMASGNDLFGDIFRAVDFGAITFNGSSFSATEKTTDQDGNVVSGSADYSASYTSDNGNSYEITSSGQDEGGLTITVKRPDCTTSPMIMNIGDYIYESICDGSLDLGYDVINSAYDNGRCRIEATPDGFVMKIQKAPEGQ